MIRGPPRTTRTATLCPSTTLFRSAPDRPGRTAIRPLPPVPTTVDRPAPAGWRLVWSDEFDGSAVDTSVWKPYHSTYGDGNRELQCLTPGNVTASGGQLTITARQERLTCPNGSTRDYSSGFLGSREPGTYFPRSIGR